MGKILDQGNCRLPSLPLKYYLIECELMFAFSNMLLNQFIRATEYGCSVLLLYVCVGKHYIFSIVFWGELWGILDSLEFKILLPHHTHALSMLNRELLQCNSLNF